MALEQLSDGAPDRATDVFGLGSLLYEMIVARPPFPAATPAALMAQQRQGAPAMLGASPELAGLARTALQHDPERRPRSAGRMAAMLERWLENRGISSADLPAVTAAALAGAGLPHSDVAPGRWQPVPVAEKPGRPSPKRSSSSAAAPVPVGSPA